MNDASVLAISVVAAVIGVVVLYFVIRFAVQQGVTAALETHEVWMRDGSLEQRLEQRAEQSAAREKQRELDRRLLNEGKLDRPA